MTDQTLAEELEALAQKATKSEWSWTDDNGVAFPRQWRLQPGVLLADGTSGTPGGDSIDRANAALIVALRNNLPAILAALRQDAAALREREVMREALKPFADRCDAAVYPDDSDSSGLTVKVGDLRRARAALQGGGE